MSDAYLSPPTHLGPPAPHHADGKRAFQGIPGIERAPSGRFWAAWYGGRGPGEDALNYVILATSPDGEAWDSPCLIIDPDDEGPVRAYDPCLWHDPDGRLWLFWAQGHEKHTDGRAGVWAICAEDSEEADTAWTGPTRLCDGIMMNKPLATRAGDWLLPVARWKRDGSSEVVASTDHGATWRKRGSASIPDSAQRSCDEHMLVEREDGSLWMWVRTNYGIGHSASRDGGRTWSDVVPSPIGHTTSRFCVRRLHSGKLLLVKHGALQVRGTRCDLTAYLSGDDGASWSHGLLLDARERVSYPDAVQDDKGRLHLIYDYDRRGAREILLHTFTENDILSGQGEIGRPPVVVNRADAA